MKNLIFLLGFWMAVFLLYARPQAGAENLERSVTALSGYTMALSDNAGAGGPVFPSVIPDIIFSLLSPSGLINWMPGEELLFEWEALEDYNGDYRLKILEQEMGEAIPIDLPEGSLFFDESGIGSNAFTYTANLPAFDLGKQYAWQVETTDEVDGEILKSVNVSAFTFPLTGSCDISLSGIPSETLCPGDCFTLEVNFEGAATEHRLILYTDYDNVFSISASPSTNAPFPVSMLDEAPLESPLHYAGSDEMTSFEVCLNEGSADPVGFAVYHYQASSICADEPLSAQCCHEVENFEVMVADIPDFTGIELEIQDQLSGEPVSETCPGDPLLFSMLNLPTTEYTSIVWQYSDDGQSWQDIEMPPFTDFTFPVNPGHPVLSIDCENNEAGFVERQFRVKLTYEESSNLCEYITPEYLLRICCPITNAGLNITTLDEGHDLEIGLCEGDTLTLDVELLAEDVFVNTPGEFVSIEWTLNEANIGNDNQTEFSVEDIVATEEDICIAAKIQNCAGKSKTFTSCINVDPAPVCDTIVLKWPDLDPVEVLPGLVVYEACPNSAFTLEALGFNQNTCTIQWEYSYDQEQWFPMGTSNTIQNTNLIIEGDFTSIFYRTLCHPLSDPSACEPCPSDNVIEIREIQPPSEPVFIDCLPEEKFCLGQLVEPYVTFEEEGIEYHWYVNGILQQDDTPLIFEYTLEANTCFQYSASNECFTIFSEPCCAEVCVPKAVISCPLPDNECACLGEVITLSGAGSESSCDGQELEYEWSWIDADGNPQEADTEIITDIPPAGGTTYSLTITDAELGCTDMTSLTIIPCDKN